MNRPTFFVKRSARLIARLQLIIYCWRFARRVDGRVVAIWPALDDFSRGIDGDHYNPSLIFDLETFYGSGGAESLVFLEGQVAAPAAPRSVSDREFAEQIRNGFDPEQFTRGSPTFHERLPIVHRFRDEPTDLDYFRRSLLETYRALPHHRQVNRVLEASRDKIAVESYVGLHVRRGDVYAGLRHVLPLVGKDLVSAPRLASCVIAYLGRTAPYDAYDAAVREAIAEGHKIVFFSDSPDSFAHFAKKFGGRHFVNADRLPRPPYPIQKAFVDFNLLLDASRIIGTAGSIYASFAAMMGGGRLVNVAGGLSLDAMEDALYADCLAGIEIGTASRALIRAEMERQYPEILRTRARMTDIPALPLK